MIPLMPFESMSKKPFSALPCFRLSFIHMRKTVFTLLLAATLLSPVFAMTPVIANDIEMQPEWMTKQLNGMLKEVLPSFQVFSYKDEATGLSVDYNLFVPEDCEEGKEYPMVVFIGDARTVGDDPLIPLEQGFGGVIWATGKEQARHPAFVLVPQFPVTILNETGMTDYVRLVPRLIEQVGKDYAVDLKRVYCTGQSMGCMSLLYLAANNPGLFAAGLFVDGQWNIDELEGLEDVPFIYMTAGGDERASAGQTEVKNRFKEKDIPFIEINGLDANSGNLNAVFKVLFQEGSKHYFLTWQKGSVLFPVPEGKRVNEHVCSFNYGYTTAVLRDWLFEQAVSD